ncbi:MAG: hypothetical protein KJP14_12805 [Eudoraea sp.]|nr:hypothetical protein [Eudoraea sp.]
MEKWLIVLLLVDAGLFVLSWMVQLIVYPGFLAYPPSDLIIWHKKYTPRITLIVAPLMLVQLFLSMWLAVNSPGVLSISVLILVLGTWITTFLFFVPIHRLIDQEQAERRDLKRLVSLNWMRTLGWSIILILDLLQYLD